MWEGVPTLHKDSHVTDKMVEPTEQLVCTLDEYQRSGIGGLVCLNVVNLSVPPEQSNAFRFGEV